eukprot:TRINITY_DN8291_c0_g1_i1.p1 TRINITY_DN8291_c0_g1~~TRINITY_DN8291_c0_g1_i1.p1  ORF type:complete len:650 (+),score=178.61 TRINITY_DN8291_c0_g1_i1:154-2103(+)
MNAIGIDPTPLFTLWFVLWCLSGLAATCGLHVWTFRPAVRRLQEYPTPPPPHFYLWVAALLLLQHCSGPFFDSIAKLSHDEWLARMDVDQLIDPFMKIFGFMFVAVAAMVGADSHAGDQVEVAHLVQVSLCGAVVLGVCSAGALLALTYGRHSVLQMFVDDSHRSTALPYFVIKVASAPLVAIQNVSLGYFVGSASANSKSSPSLRLWSWLVLCYYVSGVLGYSLLVEFAGFALVGQAVAQLLVTCVWFVAVAKVVWQAAAQARGSLAVWRQLSTPFMRARTRAAACLCTVYLLRAVTTTAVTQLRLHLASPDRDAVIQGQRVADRASWFANMWGVYQESVALMVLAHANGATKKAAELRVATGGLSGDPLPASDDFRKHVQVLLRQYGVLVLMVLLFFCVQGGIHHSPLSLFVDSFADQGPEASVDKEAVMHEIRGLWYVNTLAMCASLGGTLYTAMLCACHDFRAVRDAAAAAFLIAAVPCVAAAASTEDERWLWAARAGFEVVYVLCTAGLFHSRFASDGPVSSIGAPKHAALYFKAAQREGRLKVCVGPRDTFATPSPRGSGMYSSGKQWGSLPKPSGMYSVAPTVHDSQPASSLPTSSPHRARSPGLQVDDAGAYGAVGQDEYGCTGVGRPVTQTYPVFTGRGW